MRCLNWFTLSGSCKPRYFNYMLQCAPRLSAVEIKNLPSWIFWNARTEQNRECRACGTVSKELCRQRATWLREKTYRGQREGLEEEEALSMFLYRSDKLRLPGSARWV
jgi:hypothetical protein